MSARQKLLRKLKEFGWDLVEADYDRGSNVWTVVITGADTEVHDSWYTQSAYGEVIVGIYECYDMDDILDDIERDYKDVA